MLGARAMVAATKQDADESLAVDGRRQSELEALATIGCASQGRRQGGGVVDDDEIAGAQIVGEGRKRNDARVVAIDDDEPHGMARDLIGTKDDARVARSRRISAEIK